MEGIATSLDKFFLTHYPRIYEKNTAAIQKAIAEVQRIYQTNFFPEMKVDWRTHPDNIGHTLYPGCFRCHEGKHVSPEGKVIRSGCQLCHTIIGQKEQIVTPTEVEMPERFKHPWKLEGKHAQLSCNQCHWRGRGLEGQCTTCHTHTANAPMAFPCAQCHQKEQSLKPILACITCHPTRTELHLKPTHSVSECTTCHIPHEWKVTTKDICFTCHQDKAAHNPEGICRDCHQFRPPAKSS